METEKIVCLGFGVSWCVVCDPEQAGRTYAPKVLVNTTCACGNETTYKSLEGGGFYAIQSKQKGQFSI